MTDYLVSSLLPVMDAEEEVMFRCLDTDLCDALKTDHRQVRLLTERLAMLSENAERSRRRTPETKRVDRALREAMTALEVLGVHQSAAFCRLREILPVKDQEQIAAALQVAAAEARERTMLIVEPAIPPTASSVLRKRPDLNTAYVMSLAEIERKSIRNGEDVKDR